MSRDQVAARLAAWAGLAPGDNESGGKRRRAAARPGNQRLRTALVESAWSTARTRSRPGARYRVGWPGGSAAATRRKPPSRSRTRWPASPGQS